MKQYTVLEQLMDERDWLQARLRIIKARIAQVEHGEVETVPGTANVAGDAAAWMKAQATITR